MGWIDKAKEKANQIDYMLDDQLDKTSKGIDDFRQKDYRGKLQKGVGVVKTTTGETIRRMDERGDDITKRLGEAGSFTDKVIASIVFNPKKILAIVLFITIVIGGLGAPKMMTSIVGDMEVYLPQGDETKDIIDQVRDEANASWSTDIIIIFVESPNAIDPAHHRY